MFTVICISNKGSRHEYYSVNYIKADQAHDCVMVAEGRVPIKVCVSDFVRESGTRKVAEKVLIQNDKGNLVETITFL